MASEEANEKLQMVMQQAQNSVSQIKKGDLTELCAMKSPPVAVGVITAALCAFFQREESWEQGRLLMKEPNFIQMLVQYDANNVPMKLIKYVQKNYTEHPENG